MIALNDSQRATLDALRAASDSAATRSDTALRERWCGNVRYWTAPDFGVDLLPDATRETFRALASNYVDLFDPEAYRDSIGRDREMQAHRALRHVAAIRGPRTPDNWLDIGCSMGWTLLTVRSAGWRVRGIEASAEHAALARDRGIPVEVGLFPTPDDGERFAVVSALHVIEHVPRPDLWLTQATTRLKPDGLLLLEVPDRKGFIASVCRTLGRFAPRGASCRMWQTDFPYPHLWYFGKRSIAALLGAVGFSALRWWSNPVCEPCHERHRLAMQRGKRVGALEPCFLRNSVRIARWTGRQEFLAVLAHRTG